MLGPNGKDKLICDDTRENRVVMSTPARSYNVITITPILLDFIIVLTFYRALMHLLQS